ncbi:lipid-A-disaccharide synthase [Phyllobacterium salinisoli]|uniref:Lipid-A-disaccharide synthase n=1 Tax=Phyllobacterium salinisoli TaxID=1899321 RepID=A0A368K6R5_9HYPH|nr:lipid-A-disaccharide synthase [Phyllobacterium salinisoli]RCS24335.1 lipid-A-disaccharide synthase [Phyllobacterium salinisoli]
MARKLPLKIAIIAGEESGDLLGADLIDALRGQTDRLVNLVGVGGSHLQQRGLKSLFNPDEIALMGLGAVLKNLPKLVWRIAQTARAVVAAKPDCLIIIDSPDFTHRVAKKVRAADPTIPIVKYIAPTVWAWRPQRARTMRAYVDHVLTILPFEVDVLKRLNGPAATYAGHRLASYKPILDVRAARMNREKTRAEGEERTLLVLPGSRRSEIKTLMEPFGKAVAELAGRVETLHVILPTLPAIEPMVRTLSADWPVKPLVVTGEEEKWKAFAQADAALAASGTVSLELALAHVPTVLAYKIDWFARQFLAPRITAWSAALPNVIADQAILPEHFNEFVRPGLLARELDGLMRPGPAREAQISSFQHIAELMMTERPAGEIAAKTVLDLIGTAKSR